MPHSNYPPIIQWRRDACNGMYPSAKFIKNAVDAENHLTAHRHKEVFRCDWRMGEADRLADAEIVAHRARIRTGHGAVKLRAMVCYSRGYDHTELVIPMTGTPTIRIEATLSGGATSTIGPWSAAVTRTAPTDAPSSLTYAVADIAVDANSIYELAVITAHYARPISISIAEIGDPTVQE